MLVVQFVHIPQMSQASITTRPIHWQSSQDGKLGITVCRFAACPVAVIKLSSGSAIPVAVWPSSSSTSSIFLIPLHLSWYENKRKNQVQLHISGQVLVAE